MPWAAVTMSMPRRWAQCFSMAPVRCVDVDLQAATEKVVGVDAAEHEVGVGDGRLVAAEPVAGGTGVGAGAARTNPQPAPGIHPGDAAAAGADLHQIDHRRGGYFWRHAYQVPRSGTPFRLRREY